jgi:hypothetical protein
VQTEFIPGSTETYLSDKQLGDRWGCHEKTAAKRFRKLGGSTLLLGGSTRFPLSQVIQIEREGLSRFAARVTEKPERLIEGLKRHRKQRQKEREERQARRQKAKEAATTEPAIK